MSVHACGSMRARAERERPVQVHYIARQRGGGGGGGMQRGGVL